MVTSSHIYSIVGTQIPIVNHQCRVEKTTVMSDVCNMEANNTHI